MFPPEVALAVAGIAIHTMALVFALVIWKWEVKTQSKVALWIYILVTLLVVDFVSGVGEFPIAYCTGITIQLVFLVGLLFWFLGHILFEKEKESL
ncbi:MAG: hypothetical protein WBE27_01900 [Microgenomates group bacterium]